MKRVHNIGHINYAIRVFFFENVSLPEEQGAHERQLLKVFKRDRLFEQLPVLLQRKELVYEFPRIRQEVMIIVLVPK